MNHRPLGYHIQFAGRALLPTILVLFSSGCTASAPGLPPGINGVAAASSLNFSEAQFYRLPGTSAMETSRENKNSVFYVPHQIGRILVYAALVPFYPDILLGTPLTRIAEREGRALGRAAISD